MSQQGPIRLVQSYAATLTLVVVGLRNIDRNHAVKVSSHYLRGRLSNLGVREKIPGQALIVIRPRCERQLQTKKSIEKAALGLFDLPPPLKIHGQT
jgi:hypothetical protein